jgi:cytoskeletal protein CcmA (bactofilin family)
MKLYGRDAAGNLSFEPLGIDVRVDNRGPKVIVGTRRSLVQLGGAPVSVLSGTVSDANGVAEMYAGLQTPSGMQWIEVNREGEAWSLVPLIQQVGAHTIRLYARDGVGNLGGYGPYRFMVTLEALAFVVEAGPDQYLESAVPISLAPATFYDADPARSHTSTVDWGDGTSQAIAVAESEGTGTISGSHLYAADGTYTVVVCVQVLGGETQVCDSFAITVQSKQLVMGAIPDRSGNEGEEIVLVAAFEAKGTTAPYTAGIDWGDGISEQAAVSESGGQGSVTGAHIYADNGVYHGTVTVSSADSAQASGGFTVTVGNVAPSVTLTGPASADEGQTLSYGYTVSDPGADTFILVEASCGAGALSNSSFDPSTGAGGFDCMFPDGPASVGVSVTVADDDGGAGTRELDVMVNNVAPIVALSGPPSVDEGQIASYSYMVTDPGGDTFALSGESCGVGSLSNSSFEASTGAGAFDCIFPDGPATSTVSVEVTDDDGAVGTDSQDVAINNVPPTVEAGQDQTVSEGESVSLSPATFSDPGTGDTHTATVSWGDGTPVEGVFENFPWQVTNGSISGTHVYADNGSYVVEVCVTDDDGATSCDSFTAGVQNAPPTVEAGPDQTVFEGDTAVLAPASFHDPGTLDTHTAAIDWGDGTVESATVEEEPYGPPGSSIGLQGTVSGSHVYAAPGSYTVTVTVMDDEGGAASDALVVTVKHGFLRFCLFANGRGGLSIFHEADIQCAIAPDGSASGGVASRDKMRILHRVSVHGELVSLEEQVDLMNQATVEGDATAMGDVSLSNGASLSGDAVSGADIILRNGSVIEGDATAAGSVVLHGGSSIHGGIQENSCTPAIADITFVDLEIEGGREDVVVHRHQIRVLDPGRYKHLLVMPDSTIIFRSGTYGFEKILVMWDASIDLDLAGGPIVIEVEGDLFMMEDVQMGIHSGAGDAGDVSFRIGGKHAHLGRGGQYLGTFLAPGGMIMLHADAILNGALYGDTVAVMQRARVVSPASAETATR